MTGGNMRVKVLLDLVNRLSPNAKVARNDLRGVGTEAKALQGVKGGDKLNASLKVTAKEASLAQAAIARARAEAKALASTNVKPKGLDQLRKDLGGMQNRRAPGWSPPRAGSSAAKVPAEGGGLSAGQGAALGAAGAGARGALMRAAPVLAPAAVTAKGIATFKDLESAEKELAITTDETDATVRRATEGFREQSGVLGTTATDMVKAAQLFAASGQDFKTSTASVTPTVKTAKAAFAEVNDVATSGIAVMQNLKVPVSQLQEAYDRMAVSAKEGQVEMKDLARELPGALASYSLVGKSGLEGLSDVTAQMQIMRRYTSTASEASNRLQNFYSKATAEETVKNFKEQRINLQKEVEKGAKQGESTIDTVLRLTDKVVRLKNGEIDTFKLNSLFGDKEAREFAIAMLRNIKERKDLSDKITKTGAGTVDKDFNRATDRMQADFDRLAASWDRTVGRMGEAAKPAAASMAGYFADVLDAVDAKLKKLNDETRSGPMERLRAGQRGRDAAKREFEGESALRPVDLSGISEEKAEYYNPVIDWLTDALGVGKAGDRDKDLTSRENDAYRAEREKRMTAMQDAARRKLESAIDRRQNLEAGPANSPSRRSKLAETRAEEVDANEQVRRAEQFRAGKEKDLLDLKRMATDLSGINATLQAVQKMKPGATGHKFITKPGAGEKTTAGDAIGGAGAGAGKLGFGLGGPVAKDILQSLQVEMKPAGALITQQIADGIKSGQGQTDSAAQQVGEGVKTQLTSVEAAGAGQKIMADFAASITSNGAAAVAAAQKVASDVKSALASAGGGGGGLRNTLSGRLHD